MNRDRLFLGSCFSLISTSVGFAAIGAILGPLRTEFALSNQELGYIGGASLLGFPLSIFVLGPFCDTLGMKNLMRFAMLCHLVGALIIMLTTTNAAFWMLFSGALIFAIGNGTVEAVCNPLIATMYPDQKTKKLNQFHVWFPGGILIGGIASYMLGADLVADFLKDIDVSLWRVNLGLIIIPTVIYGFIFAGQEFPATERVQSGVSFGGMVRGALGRPLFIVLLLCMCITASLELGPGKWVPPVLEAGGIAGILVLAYINGLMAILRFFAGPVVHRLSPTGILVASAVFSGVGLYWFSFAESAAMAFASATVFAVGVCYFWPTMLGVVSERVPKSGAFGLALMGGTGMLMAGLVTVPLMGRIADGHLHQQLDDGQTRAVLQRVADVYPAAAVEQPPVIRDDAASAVSAAIKIVAAPELPEGDTAKALRDAVKLNPGGNNADAVVSEIEAILDPADNYGGRMSFRYVAPFSIVIIIVFGVLYLRDRKAGGYAVESIGGA